MATGLPAKLTDNQIPFAEPKATNLFYFADENTGKGRKNTLASLLGMVGNVVGGRSVFRYADVASMLLNEEATVNALVIVNDAFGDPVAIGGLTLYIFNGPIELRGELSSYEIIAQSRNRNSRGEWSILDKGDYPKQANGAIGSGPGGLLQVGDFWNVPLNQGGILPTGELDGGLPSADEMVPGRTFIYITFSPPSEPEHYKLV